MGRLGIFLTFFGATPFVWGLAAILMGRETSVLLEDTLLVIPYWEDIFLTYAAIILSFLAGIHWGVVVMDVKDGFRPKHMTSLLLSSTAISLVAWVCLLLTHRGVALAILAACYVAVYVIDHTLTKGGHFPKGYLKMRSLITLLVVPILATASVVLWGV